MSLLSMRVFGYDLQLELIPANQRMIMHEDYEELAVSVMSMVDLLVHKTSDMIQREREGHPDEGFLSEVSAQLPQAKEDEDKPGLEAMLLKVLQLYASSILSKRSCAKKGEDVLKAEQEGGSSQQCILIEYLKGIQSREEETNVQVLHVSSMTSCF
ncbi:hypothetical protein NC652_023855 [Populus alba x Populus x berolinensis]|nr:hypothetical protein NC652_023855 [Populus alba x Populus x berolinensis]